MTDFPSDHEFLPVSPDAIGQRAEHGRTVTFRQPDPVAPAVTLQSAAEDLANACAEVERIAAAIGKAQATLSSLGREMDVARDAHETAQRQFSAALADSARTRAGLKR